jgi:aromatic-L-amino-acid decarboxylase
MIRRHVAWAEELAALVDADSEFELVTQPVLSLFSFRYAPAGAKDLDALNQTLVERINDDGRIYVTQTRHDDRFVIRFQVGQTSTMRADVMVAWDVIRELAATLPRAIDGSARAVS